RESLDSILAQTYRPIEVLVADDASTDETPEILASYGSAIRTLRQQRNKGIYDNVNGGIAMAKGEWIAVYHADDVYPPENVEREAEVLRRHPQAGGGLLPLPRGPPGGGGGRRLGPPP